LLTARTFSATKPQQPHEQATHTHGKHAQKINKKPRQQFNKHVNNQTQLTPRTTPTRITTPNDMPTTPLPRPLLFGGDIVVDHERGEVSVDCWIVFKTTPAVGVLCKLVREELNQMLLWMVEAPADPHLKDQVGEMVCNGLLQLCTAIHARVASGSAAI
jgi:hypothetical protein